MSESHNRGSDHPSEAIRMGRIIYETRINGETLAREIPFVVGVLADLSGAPLAPLPLFSDREFVEVREENLDQILAAAEPRLTVRVENTLTGDGSQLVCRSEIPKAGGLRTGVRRSIGRAASSPPRRQGPARDSCTGRGEEQTA